MKKVVTALKIDVNTFPWLSAFLLLCLTERTLWIVKTRPTYHAPAILAYWFTHLWYMLLIACFVGKSFGALRLKKRSDIFVATAIIGVLALALNKYVTNPIFGL